MKHLLPHFMHLENLPAGLPTLTKYERASLIGLEAERLSNDGECLVPIGDSTSVTELAERTLLAGLLPHILDRPMPSGGVVGIRVGDLDVQWDMCNNR